MDTSVWFMLDILCGYFQGKKNGYCQLFNKALSYIPHFMCYDDVNWWFLFFLFFCPLFFFFFAMMIMVFLLSQSDSTMTIWDSTLFSSYVRKTLLASVSLYTLYYQDSDAFFFLYFFLYFLHLLLFPTICMHIYTYIYTMMKNGSLHSQFPR